MLHDIKYLQHSYTSGFTINENSIQLSDNFANDEAKQEGTDVDSV